jgi:hypothetical protein
MNEQGGEQRMNIGCHIDQNGALIKLNRLAYKEDSITTEDYNERLTTDVE